MTDDPDISGLDESERDLPLQTLLQTFSSPLARSAVYYLSEEEQDSLDHLTDVVTGWMYANADRVATRSDRERIRIRLYHVYLPELDSIGALSFDADNRTIEMTDTSPAIEAFIDWLRELDSLPENNDLP